MYTQITNRVGGIVGSVDSSLVTMDSNINNGEVSSDTYAGGILGYNRTWKASITTTINNSINKGLISATTSAGGIAGQIDNTSNFSNCLNIGEVKSKTGKASNHHKNMGLHLRNPRNKIEELELEILKKDIEIARLKKGYMVKGVGAEKEFVTTFDKNMKQLIDIKINIQ